MTLKKLVHHLVNRNPRLRRLLLRILAGSGETTVSLLGVRLRVDKVRENGYLRAARAADMSSLLGDEVPVLLTLASLIPRIDTFVDAGANVGVYSTVLGRLHSLNPSLHCIAFEADPLTFERLKGNLSGPQFSCHNVALAENAGTLRFIRGAVSHVTTTLDKVNAYSIGDCFEVPCRRLDSFDIPGSRVLLKIDVEGQELAVLLGGSRLFEEDRCVGVYFDGCDRQPEIERFLSERGFEFFDGRTAEPAAPGTFALLALKRSWLPGPTASAHFTPNL